MSVIESIAGRTVDDPTEAEALFEEARRRRRRRWRTGGVAFLVLTLGTGVLLSIAGGGASPWSPGAQKAAVRHPPARTGPSTTVPTRLSASVTSVPLPSGFSFSSVSASGHTVWLSGGAAAPTAGSCNTAELAITTGNLRARQMVQ